jgi:hypothetical protein
MNRNDPSENIDNRETLLPCPFCGGTAVKSKFSDNVICDCLRASNNWVPVSVWQKRAKEKIQ